jgi:antitoxin component of RelBE/YafQ-DinJ toxin-antitoxin module
MKTVTMNIRVDETLRAQFVQTAEQLDRSAAQLIRGFMRDVVARYSAPATTAPQSCITEAERKERREAVDYARASVALEGFHCLPQYEEKAQQCIDGEIDSDALTEYALRLVHENLSDRP